MGRPRPLLERQVRIDPGGKQQVMLNAIVAELDRTKLETQGIDISAALVKAGISLTSLPGTVATPYGPTSQLRAEPVRFPACSSRRPTFAAAAVQHDDLRAGRPRVPNFATQSLFQFLEPHSLGRILAQPHLLANSGESRAFLSGGEIPIVIAQALNTSIVFKQFGTELDCRPTVIGRDDIELLVKTEVSEPDYAHGVQLFGFTVPAFVTRKAETLVRLQDGQTLIIAGLILRQPQCGGEQGSLSRRHAIRRRDVPQHQLAGPEDRAGDVRCAPEIVAPAATQWRRCSLPSERGPLTRGRSPDPRAGTPRRSAAAVLADGRRRELPVAADRFEQREEGGVAIELVGDRD